MITSIKIPSQLQLILLMTRRKGAGPEEIVQPSNVLKLNTPSWMEHIFLHLPVPRHKCANLKAENVTEELFHPKAVPFKLCRLLRQHIFSVISLHLYFQFHQPTCFSRMRRRTCPHLYCCTWKQNRCGELI